MNFFKLAFSESGSPSSMRVMAGIIVIAWCIVFVRAGWQMQSFPPMTLEHVGILAIPFGAKAWQKGKENKPEKKYENP